MGAKPSSAWRGLAPQVRAKRMSEAFVPTGALPVRRAAWFEKKARDSGGDLLEAVESLEWWEGGRPGFGGADGHLGKWNRREGM